MASHPDLDHATYRPSGKVRWARYLPALIIPFGISVAMAFVLCWAFIHDWYYSFFLPALAALPVAIAVRLAGVIGHSRNRLVACLVGALAGAFMYLGYYHLHFVSVVGRPGIARVNLLPKFIKWRMRTDSSVDRNDQPRPPRPARNWTYFAIDLVLAVTIVAGLAWARAGRAYCESCGRWMRRLLMVAPPGTGPPLAEALTQHQLESLDHIEAVLPKIRQACSMIDVEYCQGLANSPSSCLTYITVKEFNKHAARGREKAQSLLKQFALDRDQLLLLADKFPRLRSIAVRALTAGMVEPANRSLARPQDGRLLISTIGDDSVARAFSGKTGTIQMLLSLTPIFLVLLGAGLLYAGWVQLTRDAQPAPTALVLSALLIGTGLLAAGTGGVICWNNVDFLNDRYISGLTRSFIRARPDALVDPDDPAAEYVAVVPRKNWTNWVPSGHPSDRGFLLVDNRKRQLLFEGLRERYCIPADELTSCEVEGMLAAGSLMVTVVRVRGAGGPVDTAGLELEWTGWEAPFYPRPTKFGKYWAAHRRQRAESLQLQICQLMASQEPKTSP
jgi:hypothetical protein